MIEFERFPHVGEIIRHYANSLNDEKVLSLINTDVKTRGDAYILSKFVLKVIDCMASDMQQNVIVLGNIDNTSMIPDIDYEVSLYLARKGMEDIWDEVCDEQ